MRPRAALLALALGAVTPLPLPAQRPDTSRAAPAEALPQEREAGPARKPEGGQTRVSPAGAFLRSMIVPGWGHSAVGAYTRGAFYVVADGAAGGMLFKTLTFLRRAEELEARRIDNVRRRLAVQGITDPDSIAAAIDEDGEVQGARALVESRKQQRQDWLALGIFLLFLGGADAFVSAHLADFPPPVGVTPRGDGSLELRISVPVSLPWERASAPGGVRTLRE